MRSLCLQAAFIAALMAPTLAFAGSDCTCRYDGGEIAEGQFACLKTPGGMVMARCERFLNNTSWRITNNPCPTAHLSSRTGQMCARGSMDPHRSMCVPAALNG